MDVMSLRAHRRPAASSRRAVARAVPAVICVGALTLAGCGGDGSGGGDGGDAPAVAEDSDAEVLTAEVLDEHPFDPTAFTQGLEVMPEGDLLVSTGLNGESRIYRAPVDDASSPTVSADLDDEYFGEGSTRHAGTVWQLTWKAGTAFARDAGTLEVTDEVSYDGEGWGLCSDGDRLVMSDGSDRLSFRDPETFDETGGVDVTLDGEPVDQLNELECTGSADGPVVWANVWQTDRILRIDPSSGEVTGVLDVDLPAGDRDGADVLNGIASVDPSDSSSLSGEPGPAADLFYLTGKLWDTLYEVRIAGR